MQIRYVNTASTAGGNGTTNATSEANRAYASLQEAFAYLSTIGDLSDDYTIYCEGSAADTTPITSWDFSSSTGKRVLVTCAAGKRHGGKWNDTKYRLEITNAHVFYNQYSNNITLEYIQAKLTVTNGSTYNIFRLATANNIGDYGIDHRLLNCIAWGVRTSGYIYGYIDSNPYGTGTQKCVRVNCIAYGCLNGFNSAWDADHLKNYNCTAYGNTYNYVDAQACKNCISATPLAGAGYGFVSTGSKDNYNNASDDNTAPGIDYRRAQTFSFVDAANGDFHLQSTDAGAIGYGKNLYNDSFYPFQTDIDGQDRGGSGAQWDIGADEYVAGGASSKSMHHIMNQ